MRQAADEEAARRDAAAGVSHAVLDSSTAFASVKRIAPGSLEEDHPGGWNRRRSVNLLLSGIGFTECARLHERISDERITGHGPKDVCQSQAPECSRGLVFDPIPFAGVCCDP